MRRLLKIAWAPRGLQDPARLVSLALGASITVEVVHALILAIGGASHGQQTGIRASLQQPPRRAAVDVHGILEAHLFGVVVDPGAQDPANAPMSRTNLELAGTIATQDPNHGFAIIRGDGPANVYKIGDRVGGASLRLVYLDRVILNRGGSLETLRLPRSTPTQPASAQAARRPAAAIADSDPSLSEPTEAHTASDVMRGTPSFGQPGKLRGFRVYGSEDSSVFERSGLRNGDLVIAINGASLRDQGARQGQQIFDTLMTSAQATVTVQRNGHTQDVTINAAEPPGG
jgi:general secretion pathway protein C